MKKIIVGITGASGTVYAIDLLEKLHRLDDVEVHLVMSQWAKKNLELETDYSLSQINELADKVYHINDQGAAIASGSFLNDGMVIVPASMKTVATIAYGIGDNLIARAADVAIKEQRKLIIVPRETPLSVIHLENLTKLARVGAQIIPPMPAFYSHPKTIQDLVNHQTMKVLDAFGIPNEVDERWK
ncbi:UbiX family flavin prenyltransferase [Pediococcus ethanolidurans]|uniref:UbiX family flavin prenyltransferase n=1 Tax=Pediococcus ethanolidurans TaxID=319653 RepID=UPI001C1EE39A|nr:UbiX family flavin prenyltransferase [Pediococcus ethanolidurans]MBU7555096.1 UbiX family flavin prenyltransferase [Pediococcus ethanolidurans]MBU7564074.1 UbiX family flavin prenyltransferase [Pediococcus ethanolidurans]MCT4398197.1 UbiX family flavin prenyltransferase [Pediococcus ethanolidurans]MCV3316028.1 UbiX family flavin prenyltransferase [Pediococcus ethanolidurans]MCV3321676.1 UbiX family flavin prenyltransferase [Pediococcus ethanolidurans]